MLNTAHKVVLEPQAQAFAEATAKPPFLADLGPEKGRTAVEEVQSGAIAKPEVEISEVQVGAISARIIKPPQTAGKLPVIFYIHGAGWVFGSANTHDRLVRELAVGTGAAVVFPNYTLSPEARYPQAIEENYAVLQWIASHGGEHGLDSERIAISGDSVGGNMSAVATIMAKQRGGPRICQQVLFYPVTNHAFDTESYQTFSENFFLRRDAMEWFWSQYLSRPEQGEDILASPLRASLEDLKDLPPALIMTAEADVLRDEGEAYANKLRQAGVPVTCVRYQGIIHDFVMLNALSETHAARSAIALAIANLRTAFNTP